jgi:geranylgeranyl diphosphate synthase type II
VNLADYLEARRADVEAALVEALPAPPRCPRVLSGAMRYSLLGGGKRLRPILVLAACESVRPGQAGTVDALAMPAACAVEMIHTYSLIHDDLPAMDDDSLRRGRQTSHVVYGEGMAILAGDGLQAEAFALLARRPETTDPDLVWRKLRALEVIAEAAGAVGMVGGQALDLDADPSRHHAGPTHKIEALPVMDAAALTDMHARKTGALIRASVMAGAIMGGADARVIEALDRYAREIGLAFQIVDDVLDVEGTSTDLGKTAGKDAASGKPTYVSLYGLDESKALATQCLSRARAAVAEVGLGHTHLAGIARWIVERRT